MKAIAFSLPTFHSGNVNKRGQGVEPIVRQCLVLCAMGDSNLMDGADHSQRVILRFSQQTYQAHLSVAVRNTNATVQAIGRQRLEPQTEAISTG